MQNTVIGVYDNYSQAQSALSELIARGFNRSNIQMSPEKESYDARKNALSTSDQDEGWSIGKFFRSMFGSDEEDSNTHSDVYHEAVRRGSYMVTVQADSEAQRDQASDILNRFSPVNVDERSSQWRTQGWSKYDRGTAPFTDEEVTRERGLYGSTATSGAVGTAGTTGKATTSKATSRAGKADMTSGESRLPVIEEELKIGKRAVQRGGVRIYQHVTERPVEETVRLRDEKVNVSRRPVNQPATEADLAAFKEGSMELRETAEEPVVSKTARVVEEVAINKEVREHDETVRDKLRRTDVDVEQLGAAGTGGTAGMQNAGAFDSGYYRSHWQNSYAGQGGRYEDYEPAYRFGNDMRGNQTYRGRSWNDMEPEVRRDWESKHAGSPWERAKDAVRHAWEKVPG
jgi:uncharacterized protein (TIGR02271 family)